jgi:ABC-type nitrate/sulfonate/bicarbonate transport system substrate-binding protein
MPSFPKGLASRHGLDPSPSLDGGLTRRTALLGLGSLAALGSGALLTGCGGDAKAAQSSDVVRYQGWPQTVLFAELAQDLGYIPHVTLKHIGSTTSGPQDIQTVATGDAEIGHAFSGAVIKLVEAGIDIRGVSNYYGSDDETFVGVFVDKKSPITSPRDLIGKTVGMNTLGAHSEAFLYEFLSTSGLNAQEISDITFVPIPPSDLEISIIRGHLDAGVIDGIAQDVAMDHGTLRTLGRDVDLFGSFPAGQMVMRQEWIDDHPETAAELAQGVDRAIRWANDQPREAVVERFTRIVSERDRGEDPSPLKYWKSTGLPRGGVMESEDFSRWETWLRDNHILNGPPSPRRYFTNSLIHTTPSKEASS